MFLARWFAIGSGGLDAPNVDCIRRDSAFARCAPAGKQDGRTAGRNDQGSRAAGRIFSVAAAPTADRIWFGGRTRPSAVGLKGVTGRPPGVVAIRFGDSRHPGLRGSYSEENYRQEHTGHPGDPAKADANKLSSRALKGLGQRPARSAGPRAKNDPRRTRRSSQLGSVRRRPEKMRK